MTDLVVPAEVLTPEAGQWITLVPVEVFGGDCPCHEARSGHRCRGWSYGLSDAVEAWSDCNRAIGHIYRVEDLPSADKFRKPGESVRVWVSNADLPFFKKVWGEDGEGG